MIRRVADLYHYRELTRNLVTRDLKVRYKNSVLGVLWSLLNPLLMTLVFTVVFTLMIPSDIPDYPVFFMCGFLPWSFFQSSLTGGTDSIVFTGGIGENGVEIRQAVCENLTELGIALDPERNRTAQGEATVHAESSRVQIWVVPTNEELVVARQTQELLRG